MELILYELSLPVCAQMKWIHIFKITQALENVRWEDVLGEMETRAPTLLSLLQKKESIDANSTPITVVI